MESNGGGLPKQWGKVGSSRKHLAFRVFFSISHTEPALGVDLKQCFMHTDLMYDCWRQNLKGGLKVVERLLGIKRRLTGVDGYIAVHLWYDYVNNNNKEALQTLLAYNEEDVVNLRVLRRKLSVK